MKIVVLAGGTSTERDISIVSGTGICRALRSRGHQAILIDVFCGAAQTDVDQAFSEDYDVDEAVSYIKSFNPSLPELIRGRKSFWGPKVLSLCEAADIVFLALHGKNGEDGRVQATFDLMGIPYTGAGYLSSGMAMDKAITKKLFWQQGVPTPRGFSFSRQDPFQYPDQHDMDFPVVVKTCCGGSSVGVYIVHQRQEYENALKLAFGYEEFVVVEQYIKGREYTMAVVNGKAYPIVEIAPKEGFYDYKNKYQPGSTVEICPAPLEEETADTMTRIALDAYRALDLEAYARFDFILNDKGKIYCLEANTLPGMTPTSLIPQEAEALGMDYADLCEELMRVSSRRCVWKD